MLRKIYCLFLPAILFLLQAQSQTVTSGFNADEYLEMLRITIGKHDSTHYKNIPNPQSHYLAYRSAEVGLKNRFDVWINDQNTEMVISLRGTVSDKSSWLENFYCAMIPAQGALHITDSTIFNYKFAEDPKATVHVGWALGIGSLMPAITAKIKEYNTTKGIKKIIVMGHSQGGALAYLLTSSLYYQIKDNQLPNDLVIKTYASAAPKPGNLYYAYDYDYITKAGNAFTIVNAADWVPETPMSIQTLQDYNAVNPFTNAEAMFGRQSFFVRLYLNHMYNRMDKTTKKAQRKYEKYLGSSLYKQVKKYLPQFKEPAYAHTMNCMRAGIPVVLQPDSNYYKQYPDTSKNTFIHHGMNPYYELVKKIYEK